MPGNYIIASKKYGGGKMNSIQDVQIGDADIIILLEDH